VVEEKEIIEEKVEEEVYAVA